MFTDPPAVHAMEDLKALLHLVTFFDLVAEGRFEEAHKVVYDTLGLFPCSDEMVGDDRSLAVSAWVSMCHT